METVFTDWLVSLDTYGPVIKAYIESHASWIAPAALSTFTIVNSLRILAYLPQILRAARDNGGASAISVMTWSLFLLSHLATIAYAVVCVGDLLMGMIFLGNALACLAIVGITLVKRRRHVATARQTSLDAGSPRSRPAMGRDPLDVVCDDTPLSPGLAREVMPR